MRGNPLDHRHLCKTSQRLSVYDAPGAVFSGSDTLEDVQPERKPSGALLGGGNGETSDLVGLD